MELMVCRVRKVYRERRVIKDHKVMPAQWDRKAKEVFKAKRENRDRKAKEDCKENEERSDRKASVANKA
jgi:hypothetical protein